LFERKFRARKDDLQLPEMLFMLTGNVLIFDHRLRTLKIVVNAFVDDAAPEKVYARAVESVDSLCNNWQSRPICRSSRLRWTKNSRCRAATFGVKSLSAQWSEPGNTFARRHLPGRLIATI